MSNKQKQDYKGLRYRCPKCGILYAYAKRCEDCGMKTMEWSPESEDEIDDRRIGGE